MEVFQSKYGVVHLVVYRNYKKWNLYSEVKHLTICDKSDLYAQVWLVPRGGKDDTIGDTILGCGYISLSELLAANHTPATAAQVLSRDFTLLSRDITFYLCHVNCG